MKLLPLTAALASENPQRAVILGKTRLIDPFEGVDIQILGASTSSGGVCIYAVKVSTGSLIPLQRSISSVNSTYGGDSSCSPRRAA